MPDYLNIHSEVIPWGHLFSYNYPPAVVMAYAIQARSATDSIYLPVDFLPQTSLKAYFVLYFMDPIYRPFMNETCRVEIYIDNKPMAFTVVPSYYRHNQEGDSVNVVTLFPVQVGGFVNVTIAPAEGSTLAPILNAMEIYTAMDVSKASNDHFLNFLALVFIISFHLLLVLM